MSPAPMHNPGLLKLDLMLRGVRVDESFYQKLGLLSDYRLGPSCFGKLDLVLPGETYVAVPYQEEFVRQSPYKLRNISGKSFLTAPNASLRIRWIRQPTFYQQKINSQVTMGDVVSVHGGFVSLALGGHRYLQPDVIDNPVSKLLITVDEVVAVLERVRKDRPLEVVALSSWDAHAADGGLAQLEPYIQAIKNAFNVLVFAELHLPREVDVIAATAAIGADSVCYHIGMLDAKATQQREAELALLKQAVKIFPSGCVMAHLTIGERPLDDLLEDIAILTQMEVLPILTIESAELVQKLTWDAQVLAPLFAAVYNLAKKRHIKLNWFTRLSPFVAPIEGRYFVGDLPRFQLALLNFYQSYLSGRRVSDLRNKQRVVK